MHISTWKKFKYKIPMPEEKISKEKISTFKKTQKIKFIKYLYKYRYLSFSDMFSRIFWPVNYNVAAVHSNGSSQMADVDLSLATLFKISNYVLLLRFK